jgi:hypothetical protein
MSDLISIAEDRRAHKSGPLEHQISTSSRDAQEANMVNGWVTSVIKRVLLYVQVEQF